MFGQYREQGVLLWRGFTFEQVTSQCFATEKDKSKGRQMPIHYGSAELNFHTISSPLGTQLPQAVGAAYADKLEQLMQGLESPHRATCVYFGDGAASEGIDLYGLQHNIQLSSQVYYNICQVTFMVQ